MSGESPAQAAVVYRSRRYADAMQVGGGILLVLCLLGVFLLPDPMGMLLARLLPAALLLLIMGIWKKRGAVATLHHDYMELQAAPAAALKRVLYSEVLRVTTKGAVLQLFYRPHTAAIDAKPLRGLVRLSEMLPEDREAFLRDLRSRLPEGVYEQS